MAVIKISPLIFPSRLTIETHWILQVIKLRGQLSDAEKEIRRLSDGVSTNSPTSSLSNVADVDPQFFGEFDAVGGYDNVFYIPESINYVSGMDWGLFIWYVIKEHFNVYVDSDHLM